LKRWTFNLGTALSLALLLATIAVAAWSWSTPRVISRRHLERRNAVIFSAGRIGFARIEFPFPAEGWLVHAAAPGARTAAVMTGMNGRIGRLGFGVETYTTKPTPRGAVLVADITDSSGIAIDRPSAIHVAVMPLWVCVLAALPIPIFRFRTARQRRRRLGTGGCLNCGYDLRASPERCPECGAAPPPVDPAPPRRRLGRAIMLASALLCVALLAGISTAAAKRAAADAPIARFTFDRGANDDAGLRASAELKNAPIADGALVLSGVYEHGSPPGRGYRAVLRVPRLMYGGFTVTWRFKIDPIEKRLAVGGLTDRPFVTALLVGGTSHRWLTVTRERDGRLTIGFNNRDLLIDVPGAQIGDGVWVRMACSFDLAQNRMLVMLNGRKVGDIRLPADFMLSVIGSNADDTDRCFTFTNYSNAHTFTGRVDELTVYPRAMTEAEMVRRWSAWEASR